MTGVTGNGWKSVLIISRVTGSVVGSGMRGLTCVLRWADTVAVTLLVHRTRHSGRGQPPIGAQRVGGDRGVWPVEGPLACVAVASSRASLGGTPGCGV